MSTTSTITLTTVTTSTPASPPPPTHAAHTVTWVEGTVDNEGMGKKKSKKCCIFKKRKPFGESSSDESEAECNDAQSCKHKSK